MKRWRVLRVGSDPRHADLYGPLQEIAEIVSVPATREAVAAALPDCDACLTGITVRLDREMLERAPRLRAIAFSATGRDHIDLACAAERGIAILSLKDDTEFLSRVTCTGELAWGLLLSVVRRLPWAFDWVKTGHWRGQQFCGHQLSGMTLGVLGYGRLGRIVAQYGQAFRMRVLAHDTLARSPDPGVTMVDFDALLREADVLTIHIHLQGNEQFIDRSAFARMKPGAWLVNTRRGGVIDEAAFLEALESGRLAGAGVDVIEGEWDPNIGDHPLVRYARAHDNLVISPHIGGVTFESQRMTTAHTLAKLKSFLENLA